MYCEFVKKSFLQQFSYKANLLLKVISSFIFLFVTVSIWKALYINKPLVDGINLREMLSYILVVQLLRIVVKMPVSSYIGQRISTGMITVDFVRPVTLKYCAISDSLGIALFNLVTTGIPMLILGILLWGIVIPEQIFQWICTVISIFLSMLLYATLEYIMGLTTFWTKTAYHIQWIMGAFYTLFSGANIPLWFYPEPVRTVANFLPFKYFAFEPVNLFLGKVSKNEAINSLLCECAWIVLLCIIERMLWAMAQKVITIQGG